jgi:GNAT superfamily N-acetyltransferase
MEIRQFTQNDSGFWQLMGPFLVDNQVRKELGMAISSDSSYTWFLAVLDSQCIGFCAAKRINSATYFNGDGFEFRHRYVKRGYRGKGIGRKLMDARLEFADGSNIKSTVTPGSQATYERLGFKKVSQKGKYPLMVKVL